jgi:hypothetical protein
LSGRVAEQPCHSLVWRRIEQEAIKMFLRRSEGKNALLNGLFSTGQDASPTNQAAIVGSALQDPRV